MMIVEHTTREITDGYLNSRKACRLLDVTRPTLAKLIDLGVLPKPVRLPSGQRRWLESEVRSAFEALRT